MAPEIPTQYSFQELLTYSFPGFFNALTFFMLIDVLSPINITALVVKDAIGLATFIGFVILAGTILGVIIDGIHHSVLEDIVFENFLGLKEIGELFKALYPSEDLKLNSRYFFKIMEEKAIDNFEFLINSTYRYSEFYANTFISLIPFSFIVPFYLVDVFQVPWNWSLLLGLVSLIVAFTCLKESYEDLKAYDEHKFSLICGYLDYGSYIHVTSNLCGSSNLKATIEATIIYKASKLPLPEKDIEVIFKTTLGDIQPQNNGKTDSSGVARGILISDKCGTAIVTATSKGCFPGIIKVPFSLY